MMMARRKASQQLGDVFFAYPRNIEQIRSIDGFSESGQGCACDCTALCRRGHSDHLSMLHHDRDPQEISARGPARNAREGIGRRITLAAGVCQIVLYLQPVHLTQDIDPAEGPQPESMRSGSRRITLPEDSAAINLRACLPLTATVAFQPSPGESGFASRTRGTPRATTSVRPLPRPG